MTDKLTAKQILFCEAYLETLNATEAARRADYGGENATENTLASIGSQNLRKINVMNYINERMKEKIMPANEVMARLSEMASADINDVVMDDGTLDPRKLRKTGRLVKSIKQSKYGTEVTLHDAQAALEKLGRYHSLFNDRVDNLNIDLSQLSDTQLERLAAGESIIDVLVNKGGG